MADLIDKQAALDAITDELMPSTPLSVVIRAKNRLKGLPAVQPDHTADIGKKVEAEDCISRRAAIDALDKRFDDVPMELTTEILQLRRDLRERIPSAQPATNCSEIPNGSDDTISRQAALDAIKAWCADYPLELQEPIDDCWNSVRELPIVRPEIIRCKDCWHRDPEDKKCDCGHDIRWQLPRHDDWYCADAERRTDG